MNTPSHLIINAAIRKASRQKVDIPRSAFLWGAVAPDLPLYALSVGGFLFFRFGQGWDMRRTFDHMYDYLFFNDPFWMALHNFLHAPLVLAIGMAIFWRYRSSEGTFGRWLFWFLVSCAIHTAIDITCHVNDGPLLLFPFEWSVRFHSPVSYWDDRYYGREFAIFENSLALILLGYLVGPWIWRKISNWGKPALPNAE